MLGCAGLGQPLEALERPGAGEAQPVLLGPVWGAGRRGEAPGAVPGGAQGAGRQREGALGGAGTLQGPHGLRLIANAPLGLAGKIEAGTN